MQRAASARSLTRAGVVTPDSEVAVRQVRFQSLAEHVPLGGAREVGEPFFLGRAEATLRLPGRDAPASRDVHVYEAYWAPLTEGRITLAQTIRFLLTTGMNGITHSFRSIARYDGVSGIGDPPIVDKPRPHRNVLWSFGLLLILFAVISMNVAISIAQLQRLVSQDEAVSPSLLAMLTGDLWAGGGRSRGRRLGFVGLVVTPAHYWAHQSAQTYSPGATEQALLRWPAETTQQWIVAVLSRLDEGGLVSTGAEERPWRALQAHALLVWGAILFASMRGRRLLVECVGDVAIYVSAHTLSTFDQVRDDIKALVRRIVCAIYQQGRYERVVIVGHSLGSLIAYDALNAAMLADSLSGAHP